MLAPEGLHPVISLPPQVTPSFYPKVKIHSLAYTIQKMAAVSSVVLGGASLFTACTLVGLATAGLAIPIAAPFVLGSLGAAGVTGGGCVLGSLKVHRAAQKVWIAAHLLKQETGTLEQLLKEQGPIAASLVEKLENLRMQAKHLEEKLDQGNRGLEEAEQKIDYTKKQKKAWKNSLNQVQSLTHSLNEACIKLHNLPASDQEMQTLEKQMDKIMGKLDQLNKHLCRIEPSLKEHNQELEQLKKDLACLQEIKRSFEQPSTELEKIANSIQSKTTRLG